MEIVFVFTHLIMLICSIGIIYISITSENSDESEIKKSVAAPSSFFLRSKSIKITTVTFFRVAASFFVAFTKLF